LYRNKKETAQKEKQYTKQYKNTEYTKQKTKLQNKNKHKKNITSIQGDSGGICNTLGNDSMYDSKP